jgi:CDP-paratose 2-epimerase
MFFNKKEIMKTCLVTGAAGLIGSEVARYFLDLGCKVVGVDNNMRKWFFGPNGDTEHVAESLLNNVNYFHESCDIRDRDEIERIFKQKKPDFIVHAAAQPSHDLAAKIPYEDFHTNAVGTLNLLESTRQFCKDSPFIQVSTNKVYGDTPNRLKLVEKDTRYDYSEKELYEGIDETMSIDQTTHSLFGASKTAGDLLAQEYGRYFNMPVGVFRGGCLTGPQHAGVELHGFLSYIVKCAVQNKPYTIFGYKGKQVRDQIHSYDVCTAFYEFIKSPRPGEVYNIGGCRDNSASILEIIHILKGMGYDLKFSISDTPRVGDHICYITNMSKFKSHFPAWKHEKDLNTTIKEIVESSKIK